MQRLTQKSPPNSSVTYPDFLCHYYYEAERGPLISLSDLLLEEAEHILEHPLQLSRTGAISSKVEEGISREEQSYDYQARHP